MLFKRLVNIYFFLFQDLFPGVVLPEHDYGTLQQYIVDALVAKGLQPVTILIKKVIQLFETMLVRHGVMLVGPTGGGKTTCYEVSTEIIKNTHETFLLSEIINIMYSLLFYISV